MRGARNGPFWSYVSQGDDCWLWTGSVQSAGYGSWSGQGRGSSAE